MEGQGNMRKILLCVVLTLALLLLAALVVNKAWHQEYLDAFLGKHAV